MNTGSQDRSSVVLQDRGEVSIIDKIHVKM